MVNDLHGHLAGDKALRAIAHVFRILLREYDLAGRFGGEEFAVLLPQTSAADARQIAERVRLHIAETPVRISDDPAAAPVQITVSMGVAALGQTWERTTGSQLTDLLAGADRALYQAKNAGRNHVVMVTDTETVGDRRSGQADRAGRPRLSAIGCWPGAAASHRHAPAGRRSCQAEGDAEADPEVKASTARISEGPCEHFDASPVRRICGVSNPSHTQPLMETGPPPPLPGAFPDASAVA